MTSIFLLFIHATKKPTATIGFRVGFPGEIRIIFYLVVLFQPEKQSCHGVSVPRDEGIEIATLAVYVLVCCYKRHGGDYSEDKSHPVKQRGQAKR